MTCEWLESDNCWRQTVARIRSCAPVEPGSFDEIGKVCRYDDGASIEFDGTVERPTGNQVGLPIIQHRLLDADGRPCFTTQFLGAFDGAINAGGLVTRLRSDEFDAAVVCSDGTTYASNVEGSCEDIGRRWLDGELPGYSVVCDEGGCRHTFNGGNDVGPENLATCEF